MKNAILVMVPLIVGLGCATSPEAQKEQNRFELSKMIDQGRELERQNQFDQAEKIYKQVRALSGSSDLEVYLMSEWRLSYTAEARGDYSEALAHVFTVEKNIEQARPVSLIAEVPSRKALLYFRLGQSLQAEAAVREAEKNLQFLLSLPRFSAEPATLARVYLDMGRSYSPQELNSDFIPTLRAQQQSQKYLLRSMRYGLVPLSQEASNILKNNIQILFKSAENIKLNKTDLDSYSMALRVREEKSIRLSELQVVLSEAFALKPLHEGFPVELDFYKFLEEQIAQIQKQLYSTGEQNGLTEESKHLNDLRRDWLGR